MPTSVIVVGIVGFGLGAWQTDLKLGLICGGHVCPDHVGTYGLSH